MIRKPLLCEGPAIADIPSASPPQVIKPEVPKTESKFLPHGLLFAPLHADPRWPHFSAIYRNFTSGFGLDKGFSGNFGETFSIYRNKAPFGGEWDFGVQGGVFSIFDAGKESIDLINADRTQEVLAVIERLDAGAYV